MEDQELDRNAVILLSTAMVLGLALSLSWAAPTDHFALAFSTMCAFTGFIIGLVAALQREPVLADRLTHWDSTAFFYALSLVGQAFDTMHRAAAATQPGL